jgi:hypothetical protein
MDLATTLGRSHLRVSRQGNMRMLRSTSMTSKISDNEYASLLHYLRERTVFGHGWSGEHIFNWQKSAALLDVALARGSQVPSMKSLRSSLSEISNLDEWTFSMQVAEALPLSTNYLDGNRAQTQFALIDAADLLPKIAKENRVPLLSALVEYGIGDDIASQVLKQIIYDYSRPQRRMVKSFRLDTVGGELITEAQIAMTTWNLTARVLKHPSLIGAKDRGARVFLDMMRSSTEQPDPTFAIFIDKGIFQYWQEFIDFRLTLKKVAPESHVFIVGNGGFDYHKGEKRLYYINPISCIRFPIDIVYTVADARRLLADGLPLLEAILDSSVHIEPTLNPLLNNYHLLRGLLFHENQRFQDLFVDALKQNQINAPEQVLMRAKEQTIPLSIVDGENALDFKLFGLGEGRYSWMELIQDLECREHRQKIFPTALRKKVIVRILLSHDLNRVSGGRGSIRIADLSSRAFVSLLRASLEGMRELRETGKTNKAIIGLEPLIQHSPRNLRVFNFENEEVVFVDMDAIYRFCPFYFRLPAKKPELFAALSFYSQLGPTNFKLGGKIYAVGGHFVG